MPATESQLEAAGSRGWIENIKRTILPEVQKQLRITIPLIPMNSTWFIKTAITTAFLGRLGELQLAAGTLGFTFANVTGFSILTGLCWAMEPICGQAHGAKNYKLLHRTLSMAIILLLVTCIPIFFLWLYVDKILLLFGQQSDISKLAKTYVIYLLPDLLVTCFLCPLKTYLSSQGITLPILFSSAVALAFHVPFNILLARAKGLRGVALAVGLTDLTATIALAIYVFVGERRKSEGGEGGGWWSEHRASEWLRLLCLSVQCCVIGCFEWWCYEILILLAGRLPDARRAVAVLTVVLNFDYLLYAAMISLATCSSTRVSNELGAGNARPARRAAYVSLALSIVGGWTGGLLMVALRGCWGALFSHDEGVDDRVRDMLLFMAMFEVFNFPLGASGGVVRGTARPWLGTSSAVGFYMVGLPISVALSFKAKLGLSGLLLGFTVGSASSLILFCVLVARIAWEEEAAKARELASANAGDDGYAAGDDAALKITRDDSFLC